MIIAKILAVVLGIGVLVVGIVVALAIAVKPILTDKDSYENMGE